MGCYFQQCLWFSAAESMSIYMCQAGLHFFYKYLNCCGQHPYSYVFSILCNYHQHLHTINVYALTAL